MDEDNELLDSENETDDQESEEDLESAESTDEESSDVEDVDALKEKNRQLFARAKRAEADLKKLKDQPKAEEKKPDAQVDESKINAILDKRDLESLDLSDELKREVQNYAKLNNVSVKKALSSDYIQFQKEKHEKKERAEEASLGSKGKAPLKKDYSTAKPEDFDLRTDEGRKEFAKYEEHLRKTLG